MKKKKNKIPDGKRLQQKAIKIRIYPDDKQSVLLEKTFGCCRYIWNNMLSDEQRFYSETDAHFIPTPAHYKNSAPFLKEVDSLALANVQLDLNAAFSSFFKNDKGYPNFKSKKKSKKSYTTNCVNGSIRFVKGAIVLPKLGNVKCNLHRTPMKGWKLKSVTVSRNSSYKYYASILFEYIEDIPKKVIPQIENTVGLDYSSSFFFVDENGFSPEKEKWFRESEEKLAREQRKLSHMVYDSNNYKEQKIKVANIHEHIANQRKDFAHKLSREIANSYDCVCIEDINLKSISMSLNLGKSTMDNGFGMFRDFLEYKLDDQGKSLIRINKWFPSSKKCYNCGYIYKDLKLDERIWVCPDCGETIYRDENAAKNIKEEALKIFYEMNLA